MALEFIKNFFQKQKETEVTPEPFNTPSKQKTERTQVKEPHKSLKYSKLTWVFSDYLSHPNRSKFHVSKTLFAEEGICGAALNPSKDVLPTVTQPPQEKCCKNCLKLVSRH